VTSSVDCQEAEIRWSGRPVAEVDPERNLKQRNGPHVGEPLGISVKDSSEELELLSFPDRFDAYL